MKIIENIDDEIKNSINIHEIVLNKVLNENYIFIIGNKGPLLDFIEEGQLSAEPLQINGEKMLSPTREGEFHYTYFIMKDENLREYIEYITKDSEDIGQVDVNKLVGISFQRLKNRGFGMNFLSIKEKEYNVINVEEKVDMAFPIPTEKDVNECDKMMTDILSNPERAIEIYKKMKFGLCEYESNDTKALKKNDIKTKMITYNVKGLEDLDKSIEAENIMEMNNIKIEDTETAIDDFPWKRRIQVPAIQVDDAIKILRDKNLEIVSVEDDIE